MVEAAKRVDLSNYPASAEASSGKTYNGSSEPVSVFNAESHDEARKKAEEIADKRLTQIANRAIEINNEYSDKYWKVWTLYYESLAIAKKYDGAPIAGRLRQKALNTIVQLQTNNPVNPNELPVPKNRPACETMDGWFMSTPTTGLSAKEIAQLAEEVFGSNIIRHSLFAVLPENNSDNLSVYRAFVDSSKYDSLEDERGHFAGFSLEGKEIPKEYKNFLSLYLKDKDSFSAVEAERFWGVLSALETINAYDKSQQHGSASSTEKEDIDFFDTTNDGMLNRGDISAIELFIRSETDPEIKQALAASKKEDWNNLGFLKKISKIDTDKETKNLFDLDGDGNADEKDFEIYRKMLSNPHRLDINADGFVDKKDFELVNEYFKAIIARMKEAESFRQNMEKIAGGKERLAILEKKIEKENN